MSYIPFAIGFGFIMFDWLTGFIKAIATKTYTSTKMREGCAHKVSLVLTLLLGYGVELAQRYMDFGFSVKTASVACVLITLMEVTSIIENLCEINPELDLGKITDMFGIKITKIPDHDTDDTDNTDD